MDGGYREGAATVLILPVIRIECAEASIHITEEDEIWRSPARRR